MKTLLITFVAGLLSLSAGASLFNSEEIIEIQVTGPLKSIFADRDELTGRKYQKVKMSYRVGTQSTMTEADIKLKVRGQSRAEECEVPPLNFKFGKSSQASLFPSDDDIKFVTHCGLMTNGIRATSTDLLKEYLIYKIYNLYTPASFKVRLARISYYDDAAGLLASDYGFFLEKASSVANRNGMSYSDAKHEAAVTLLKAETGFSTLVDHDLSLVFTMIQYLTRNYDFRKYGNMKIMESQGKYVSVPYDFNDAREWGSNTDFYLRSEERGRVFPSCSWTYSTQTIQKAAALVLSKKAEVFNLFHDFSLLESKARLSLSSGIKANYSQLEEPEKIGRFLAFPNGCMLNFL